jgi:integrase
MSDNTINAALRRLGYGTNDLTVHGFRAMASTLLYERGWPGDVIEIQLARQERNKVKAAYNHAQYMDKRREMMQWWADYLDELKLGV